MTNDSRIHKYMKIARDDSIVKLDCCDSCGLPLHASERISDQSKLLVVHSKGVQCSSKACFNAMTGDRRDKVAAMDLSTITVVQTPSFL